MRQLRSIRSILAAACLILALAVSPSCGGASGGPGPSGAGQGLVLVSFIQSGIDNVALNTVLEFRFSEAVSAATISNASIQIRQGDAFGLTVPGSFETVGASVFFRPELPGLCSLADSGFQPDTEYRVQIIGFPEEFAIENTAGQRLNQTTTHQFHTRLDTDPQKFIDAVPGTAPFVFATSPADHDQAVPVEPGNKVVIHFSENVDPCSINFDNIKFEMFETGDPTEPSPFTAPNGKDSGFYAASPITPGEFTADQTPGDPFTWGADTSFDVGPPAQAIPASLDLIQDFFSTRLEITPLLTGFPDNALLVVRLSFDITDFGGESLETFALSFTTENKGPQPGTYVMEVLGETPFSADESTADVNSARAPSNVQGFLLFAGDGDNGGDLLTPSQPNAAPGCTTALQDNFGGKDDFDPASDMTLDTGASNAPCTNTADGSTAVVYEFRTFRIRSGVTVRVMGENPFIILVVGDGIIESGGTLRVRGDGAGGTPQGRGGNGASDTTNFGPGGVGVAGGGDGGDSNLAQASINHSDSGASGYGSAAPGAVPGEGGGHYGTNVGYTTFAGGVKGHGGGGGGHSTAGLPGGMLTPQGAVESPADSAGGGVYPTSGSPERLLTPSAGSGAGGGGAADQTSSSFAGYHASGGGGGAGGGFVDITSSGDLSIFGTLDVAGGRGGNGSAGFYMTSGGGGGGSGGGARLLTPNDISVGATTLITAAGGAGGTSPATTGGGFGVGNSGGAGGSGRIAMEDGDSVITGLAGATIIPADGDDGFYRGMFDASRFGGGGLMPIATTDPFIVGALNPTFGVPDTADFIMGAPSAGSPGTGSEVMWIEIQGYQLLPDGSPDLGSASMYRFVGYVTDTGVETAPAFTAGTPPSVVATPGDRPTDNNGDTEGDSITSIDGAEYIQIRITVFLKATVGPFDPGAFIDRWTIKFSSNQ